MVNKIYYLIFFSIILSLTRIIPHPPNFTPIISAAITAPLLFNSRLYSIALVVMAIFLADLIIGFHPFQFIIYSIFISISLITPIQKKYSLFALMTVGASLWFFIISNFSVWIIWDMYPKTLDGLIICYTKALPFFKNTLLSTILYTGLILAAFKYLEILKKILSLYFEKKFNYS